MTPSPRRRPETSSPRRRRSGPLAAAAQPPPPAGAASPFWRDPWAWAAVLAVVPVVLHSLGAPLGEPFADDFDYLHRALLSGPGSFFDGYGSALYWRPIGRQVYYGALSGLILSHPGVVAALHVGLLALAAALLYRAFRRAWPGPAAAAMAGFPLGMESARMLVAWPSHFMDLGALVFAALAIHEASRRRLATALAAMLGSLLCKEVGVATTLLLPWVPWLGGAGVAGGRRRWFLACGGLVGGWVLAYTLASRFGGMTLPQAFEPATRATPLLTRSAWALWHSVRAVFSLASAPGRWDAIVLGAGTVIVAGAVLMAARRGRLRDLLPGVAWGGAWFLAASAALTEVYPAWAPYRAIYASLGLGVALCALCWRAHPGALAALVALRLAAFALSPGPPPTVAGIAPQRGDAFDFEQLVRLERLVRDTRVALQERFPTLPAGAGIGWHYLPRSADYAFTGDKAVQVWYRDTTIRWIPYSEIRANPHRPLATIVEFQPDTTPQIVLVEPAAMTACLDGLAQGMRGAYDSSLVTLARADSLQRDRRAGVFFGSVAGIRSRALLGLDRFDEAERVARAGAAIWRQNVFALFVIGCVRYTLHDFDGADAYADSVLDFLPRDEEALRLKARIREARRRASAPR